MPPNNSGYNTNGSFKSSDFPNEIRSAVKKGINPQTRRRGLEYLAGIKYGKQVEMPPKQAPKFKLGNFAGSALAELNAANAVAAAKTQRNKKRAAILQSAKNRGKLASKDPKFLGLPVVNFSNNAGNAEIFAESSAENLGNKQNGMAANAELNNLLGGLPLAKTPGQVAKPVATGLLPAATGSLPAATGSLPPGTTVRNSGFGTKYSINFEPSSNATLSAFGTGGKASNINTGGINKSTNLMGPSAFAPSENNFGNAGGNTQAAATARLAKARANNPNYALTNAELNARRVGNTMMAAANTNYSGGFKKSNAAKVNNFEPSSNALLPGYGTGGKASNINTGGIALNTNLQGPAPAPAESNFANAGTNTQEAVAARVQAMKNATAGTNTPFAPSGASLGDLNDADLIVDVVFSDVKSIPRGGKIGVNLTRKDGSKFLGLPSMGLSMPGMPGMPSMPKFSMPRFSGPKIDLSWLKLPNFGHFKLPETDILGMLGRFLAALPLPTREQIVAALKKGGKFIGIALLSPLLLAAWLYEHGFNLNIKLDGLTGGLISLEDFFLGGNQPAVKEIGRKLKIATDIAKRVVTNTIAEQELLQRQVNQKTRTEESVKQQILASLDSQIANIKTTLANLSADIKQVTVDPEYDNLIEEIDFTGYKAKASNSANVVLMAELNMLLDSIQKAYEGMAEGDEATVAKKNVEKFKQIRKNFDDMLALPQKIRDEVAKTAAPGVGAKLKELGRDARSRTAKLGYNVGQFFSRGATRVASMFGRGQKFSNANRTLKNAAAARNNVQLMNNPIGAGEKKPSFFNRLKGFGSRAAGFFSRKKSPNVSAANRGLNAYKNPLLKAKYPAAAAAAYTRKNRRYNH